MRRATAGLMRLAAVAGASTASSDTASVAPASSAIAAHGTWNGRARSPKVDGHVQAAGGSSSARSASSFSLSSAT